MIRCYRKKPVVIEAMYLEPDSHSFDEAVRWMHLYGELSSVDYEDDNGGYILNVPTLEGTMRARAGDYLVKGVKNEFYPCRGDIFEGTYEEVNLAP